MPQISPIARLNGAPPGAKVSVAPGATLTATLDNVSGVDSATWAVVATDETTTPAAYALTQSGVKGETITFTAGAAGTAGILASIVNNGVDPQTGSVSTAMTATLKWFVPTDDGLEVGCVGETFQSDPIYGSTGVVNAAIRGAGGGGGGGGGPAPSNATPAAVGTAAPGVAATYARGDHVHAHGAQTDGSHHALATQLVPGFMSTTDKARVDGATSSVSASTLVMRDADGATALGGLWVGAGGTRLAGVLSHEPVSATIKAPTTYTPNAANGSRRIYLTLESTGGVIGASIGFPDGASLELFVEQGAGAPYMITFAASGLYVFSTVTGSPLIGTTQGDVDYYRFERVGIVWVCTIHVQYTKP